MFTFYCTSNLDYIYFALTKGEKKMKIEDNRNDTRKFSDLEVGIFLLMMQDFTI